MKNGPESNVARSVSIEQMRDEKRTAKSHAEQPAIRFRRQGRLIGLGICGVEKPGMHCRVVRNEHECELRIQEISMSRFRYVLGLDYTRRSSG